MLSGRRPDDLMTTEEVAKELDIDPEILRRWRREGNHAGPPFLRLGERILYRARDVQIWLDNRTNSGRSD